MEGRRFTLSLVMFLAVFGFGLYLPMSGIAVRPWGFSAVYDPQRTFGGGFLILGALTVALYLAARSTIPRNPAKAVRWFRKAAEKGGAAAQFNMGILYDTGRGVPRDLGAAVTWYRKSAEQGFAEAQFNLAQMHRRGEGAESDAAEAVKWLMKAAKQGHVLAQFNLSHMYEHGVGVDKDDTEAANWCRKAAEQGMATPSTTWARCTASARACPATPAKPPSGCAAPPLKSAPSIAACRVDLVGHRAAGQIAGQVFEEDVQCARDIGLGVVARDVRRDDQVGGRPQGRVRGQRFDVEDVEDGAGQLAPDQLVGQGRLIHDIGARHVHQSGRRLHHVQLTPPDETPRRRDRRYVDDDEVGARQHRV
jgi:hypothetical protein